MLQKIKTAVIIFKSAKKETKISVATFPLIQQTYKKENKNY